MLKYSTKLNKCNTCYQAGYFEINAYLPHSIARGQKIPIFSAAGLPHNEVQNFFVEYHVVLGRNVMLQQYRVMEVCNLLIFDAVVMSLC